MIIERRKRPYKIFDRPFVFFMGPQRSGTSWLDRYLRSRDDVCLPDDVKEVFFFDRDFDKGIGSYAAHFHPNDAHKIITEISTTSFDHELAPKRLFDVFGQDVKLVCPLRNPIVRSYSLYLHYLRYGIVTGSLKEACEQHPQILDSSRYADNIKRWLKFYDLNNINFVYQEDLESDQDLYIHEICDILDIPFVPLPIELRARFNVTTFSNFGRVAGYAQRFADWLRQHRLYFLINFAKALGMKRLIFGKEEPDAVKNEMPAEDAMFLQEQLGQEIEKFETLVGYKVAAWS